jgi:hypothetical protein
MGKILYKMTANGDIEEVKTGLIIGIKACSVLAKKRGDSVEINKGVDGAKHIKTLRHFVDDSEYSLNAFKVGAPIVPIVRSVPVPTKEVEKVGPVFIVGLTKDELKDLHEHHQKIADMLFKKIVQVALKEV